MDGMTEISTPTDALIAVLEHAEDIADLVIVALTKEGKLLLCSSATHSVERLGLLELAKFQISNSAINE